MGFFSDLFGGSRSSRSRDTTDDARARATARASSKRKSSAPKTSPRPKARPSNFGIPGSRTSDDARDRATARASSKKKSSAPKTSPRPKARPSNFGIPGSRDEDYTPTSAELAQQLADQGKKSVIPGPLSVREQVARYDRDPGMPGSVGYVDPLDPRGDYYNRESGIPGPLSGYRDEDYNALDLLAEETSPFQQTGAGFDYGGRTWMDNPPSYTSPIADTIRTFEGFSDSPYYDVNAYRAGYGSDTKTDPVTGEFTKIAEGMTVTPEEAEADLFRRTTTEFIPSVVAEIGPEFYSMDPTTQAALTSVAYNYGADWADKLPDLRDAAKSGDREAIADEIERLAGHNDGINRERRLAEARMVRSGEPVDSSIRTAVEARNSRNRMSPRVSDEEINRIQAQLDRKLPNTLIEKVLAGVAYTAPVIGPFVGAHFSSAGPKGRERLAKHHLDMINKGATPRYDADGNYIGYDPSTMSNFADRILAGGDVTPGAGMSEEDHDRFRNIYDAQADAAKTDPFGQSTEHGFILSGDDRKTGTEDDREFIVVGPGMVAEVTRDEKGSIVSLDRTGGERLDAVLGTGDITARRGVDRESDVYEGAIVDSCPEGMYLDPVTGSCTPIASVAPVGLSLNPAKRPSVGMPPAKRPSVGMPPAMPSHSDTAPLEIRSPKFF